MFEIEFRGKSTINGNWVYGHYFIDEGVNKIHSGHTIYPVHPKTVGQYLNLRDKEGNKIYHGDKLDFDEREWGGEFKPETILSEYIIGDWDLCGSKSDLREWRKVIGNIYEHENSKSV